MTRPKLIVLASEEALLRLRTRHLTDIGKPIHSLALELEAERASDPLRHLLSAKPGV